MSEVNRLDKLSVELKTIPSCISHIKVENNYCGISAYNSSITTGELGIDSPADIYGAGNKHE